MKRSVLILPRRAARTNGILLRTVCVRCAGRLLGAPDRHTSGTGLAVDRVSVMGRSRRSSLPAMGGVKGRWLEHFERIASRGRLPVGIAHTERVRRTASDTTGRQPRAGRPAARFGASPARQHDLGVQELKRLGPRPSRAQRLSASPPSLPDPQSGWPAEALEISDVDPHPIL